MRTTPPTATAGRGRRSPRRGGAILSMLLLILAVLAPAAMAEPPQDTPPDHAAEAAQDAPRNDDAADDAEAGDPDENAADNAQTGEPNENAADNAQTGEPDDDVPASDNAADNAGTGEPNDNAAENAGTDEPSENAGASEPNEHAADNAQTGEPNENAADNAPGNEDGDEDEDTTGGEGNRGHVQLSADGETFPPNNEPHLPCEFYVMFYDMREGTDTATVEFFAQPPSGGPGELLLTDTVGLNGQDTEGVTFNGSELYDLQPYVEGLTYHEQQGYHIKLTVTTTPEDVSADQKHHVFWIDCVPPEDEEEPAPADLTVTKDVTGDDAPTGDTEFEITVVCDETTEVVDLADGDTWSWNDDSDQDDLTEDSTCSIEETDDQDATTVTIEFNGDTITQGSDQDLDAGDNTVTVTNDFTDEGGGGGAAAADLIVTKTVTGDDAPASDTVFTIEVACDGDTHDALIADGDSWTWSTDATDAEALTEDSTCTVTETVDHDADVTVTFNGTEVDQGDTLDLDAGDNTVTVTNDFPADEQSGGEGVDGEQTLDDEEVVDEEAVLGDEVVRPGPTPQPASPFQPAPAPDVEEPEVQPVVAVQDSTAERLPATGIPASALALLAFALLGGGAMALRRTNPVRAW